MKRPASALGEPDELVPFSRWITPAVVKIRYDTWFFLAPVPDGAEPVIDGEEMVDARWYAPAEALAAARDGEIMLVFPTIKHLEQLSSFHSADAAAAPRALEHGRARASRASSARARRPGSCSRASPATTRDAAPALSSTAGTPGSDYGP